MTVKRMFKDVVVASLLLIATGCMSIVGTTSDKEKNKIYIGVLTDARIITHLAGDEPAWGMIGLVDLPFSLVADTVLLPYTIPHALSDREKNRYKNMKRLENSWVLP